MYKVTDKWMSDSENKRLFDKIWSNLKFSENSEFVYATKLIKWDIVVLVN
jgi:hypothetical protein